MVTSHPPVTPPVKKNETFIANIFNELPEAKTNMVTSHPPVTQETIPKKLIFIKKNIDFPVIVSYIVITL